MGFQKSRTDRSSPERVKLRVIDHKRFQLLTPFAYAAEDGEVVEVPAHDPDNLEDTTDLASVPRLLWGLLPSYGRQLRSALMHDHLCKQVDAYPSQQRGEAAAKRRRADYLFREALRNPIVGTTFDPQNRVSWFRSWIFWAGVSFARIWKFQKLAGLLLTLHVLVGVVAVYVTVGIVPMSWLESAVPFGLGDQRAAYAAIYAGAFLLSFLWIGTARVPIIGLLMGPILVPVLAVTLIAQCYMAIPDLINRWLRSKKEPKASFGPVISVPQKDTPSQARPAG